MAIRKPSGILVNGVGVYVKDPNAATGDVFEDYQRIPGAGSITLPDEAAPQNDIVTIDGSVGAAGFSGVGSATIPLPVLGQHPAHRFLAATRRSGAAIQVRIVKLAVNVVVLIDGVHPTVAALVTGLVTVTEGESRQTVKNQAREGMYAAVHATPAGATALNYDKTPLLAADANKFRAILNIDDDGDTITLAPGFMDAPAANTDITIVQPGLRWDNVQVQVAQMGDGDFQSASVVGGNLVLRPTAELPVSDVVVATAFATAATTDGSLS